ncbi:MAG: sulfite exporter TauE/SafE family protein [Candidatus Altiarchaeota archaeon]
MKKTHASGQKTDSIGIDGMVCTGCEKIIARHVQKVPGVVHVAAHYGKGICEVTYDGQTETYDRIRSAIEEKGYACKDGSSSGVSDALPIIGVLALVAGAYLAIAPFMESYAPSIGKDISIPLLFVVGAFTGFHCIAMCGGFVVSYAARKGSSYISHVKYGLAKTLSYGFFGAVFGLLGSFFTFTPLLRGVAAVIAGLFLILFGLNMLGVNLLRSLRLSTPTFVSSRIQSTNSPTSIGLLNGLMIACGPLQAIYLLAAASGSPYYGAIYLVSFGLGTLPLLLGFGVITSFLSIKMTKKILKYSGAVVLLLGLVMINRGIALTGTGYDVNTVVANAAPTVMQSPSGDAVEMDAEGSQVIRMNVTAYGWQPDRFILKTGVPVKWIIDGQQITSCNSAIQVPKYGLKFDIKKGMQTITFTPAEAGTVPWSCWMGMIPGTFIVRDDVAAKGGPVAQSQAAWSAPAPTTTASGSPSTTTAVGQKNAGSEGYQTIHMNVTASGWQPNTFVLKAGVPVKWVIDGQQLTGCNSGIKVPSLGLQFDIKKGQQTVEFTPDKAGTVPWSCWMGMIKGNFIVKENVDLTDAAQVKNALAEAPAAPSGGSCGCGGTGGCGMMGGGGLGSGAQAKPSSGCGCGMM